jgi:putative DNA primase/helicase
MDNYAEVVHQLSEFLSGFGHELRSKDLPLVVDSPKSKGCGTKGKYWYKLHSFRPDSGGSLITGSFGKYGSDQREKVAIDWKPINQAERDRKAAQLAAQRAAADAARQEESDLAAMGAADLWARASKMGASAYLTKKGVVGECCRYLANGELIVPLLRYDLPRDQALRAVQRIKPDGSKLFTKGFMKAACAVRLGDVLPGHIVLICEGYATGLTLRMACAHSLAVYVALDAGNLQHVVPLVRQLHPQSRILICADDDWRTRDPITKKLNNPGRAAAKQAAAATNDVEVVYPIFNATTRGSKDTDYNDLHARQGLEAVSRQLRTVVQGIRSIYG